MKKNISTWVIPISVSLLLHIVMLLIFSNQKSGTQALIKSAILTVELQSTQIPQAVAKPRKQILLKEKIKEPIEQQAIVKNSISNESVKSEVQTETAPSTTNNSPTNLQPFSKLTRPPAFLNKIEPVYPASEQRSGSQAYVLAEITLNGEGKVLNIKIAKSAGMYFDNAVIEAIQHSSFAPGYIEKQAVAVKVLVPFRFKLK
jgi:TonB family protein